MAHLIDKDALLAEMEKEIKRIYAGREYVGIPSNEENIVRGLQKAEDIIDTLEVKELNYKPIDKDFERDAVQFCFDNGLNTTPRIAKTIAKYFFELGLKAKGE